MQNKISSLSLRFALRKYEVDYFGHAWFSDSDSNYSHGKNVQRLNMSPRSIKQIQRQLHFKNFIVESPIDFNSKINLRVIRDKRLRDKINKSPIGDLLPIFLSQFYSMSKAISLIEKQQKCEYKFIVLTRYDIVLYRFPHQAALTTDKLLVKSNVNGFSDKIFVGKLAHIEGLDVYPNIWNLVKNAETISPEYLKMLSFQQKFGNEAEEVSEFLIRLNRGDNFKDLIHYGFKTFKKSILEERI